MNKGELGMKRLLIGVSMACVFGAMPALAAEPSTGNLDITAGLSASEVQATPEMWFYQQYHRDYMDPKLAVRRNAEFRAAQRRQRISAMKWFGFSNQRPVAGADPWHGDYSPTWTSNNAAHPFRWQGIGRSWLVALPPGAIARAY